MYFTDFIFILRWWIVLFIIGLGFLPLSSYIFSSFFDRGYGVSKILGIAVSGYLIFFLGFLHLVPFRQPYPIIILATLIALIFLISFYKKYDFSILIKKKGIFLAEEFLFLTAFIFYSFIRAHAPEIHGIEKYMDFQFVNSILRTDFFPPKDAWLSSFTINYYYFGHFITAFLTRINGISSNISYNLMIASVFALTFGGVFSIAISLIKDVFPKRSIRHYLFLFLGGLFVSFLVVLSGNLQTIYAFFIKYSGENPVPFWKLIFSPSTFPNSYWYPDATRFIYHTIHEFPSYSLAVADLHGHLSNTIFVTLTLGLLLSVYSVQKKRINPKHLLSSSIMLGIILSVMYMTNTAAAPIYAGLTFLVFLFLAYSSKRYLFYFSRYFMLFLIFLLLSIPFFISFKPFIEGVGIICAPQFLINAEKIGHFLFETNHCARSPLWQIFILYGFFYLFVFSFLFFLLKQKFKKIKESDIFVLMLIIFSSVLIILPEFIYLKDIYAAHYRANTMFKFVSEAFIMLSIASGYIIIRLASAIKYKIIKEKTIDIALVFLMLAGSVCLFFVSLYPVLAINSYYNGLKTYYGLDGTVYLKDLYPQDYQAIQWFSKNVKGQPTILEAQGDSYTDFARISANTGLPTVLGWTVHEWLWRGSYDIVAPRITDIKMIYETSSEVTAEQLLEKYNVSYVYIGNLERQKYPSLNDEKFEKLGKVVFATGTTRIYKINNF